MSKIKSETEKRVSVAAASDLLWELPVVDAMKHFRLKHDGLRAAKALALKTRPRAVGTAMDGVNARRRIDRCARIEALHPGIHRRLATGSESNAEIGRVYELTRPRVGQILAELVAVAADLGVEKTKAASRIEADTDKSA